MKYWFGPVWVVACILVVGACSSDVPAIAENPNTAAAPTAAVASPAPVANTPVPSASDSTTSVTATPTPAVAEPTNAQDVVVEIWFPRDPDSYEDFTAMFAVERSLPANVFDDRQLRVAAILDYWLAGPTNAEVTELGFIDPLPNYTVNNRCVNEQFEIEFVNDSVLATFCQFVSTPGVGADARIEESFRQTLAAAGVSDAALLLTGGQRCFGNLTEENPMACLSDGVIDAIGPGFRCPANADSSPGTISGVEEWVNARIAPSLYADVVGRFTFDQPVNFYVEPGVVHRDGLAWVAVEQATAGRCVAVAAQFITTDTGPLDQAPIGISYDLPQTGNWLLSPRSGAFGRTSWTQDAGLYIGVSIDVAQGTRIDEYIADKQAQFAEWNYEPEDGWNLDVEVAGADRALPRTSSASESGDLFSTIQLLEVGGHTITIEMGVYFEDVQTAPIAEMRAFMESVTIDRDLFLQTVTG